MQFHSQNGNRANYYDYCRSRCLESWAINDKLRNSISPFVAPILHDSLIMVIAASGNHSPLADSESPFSFLPSELAAELKILRFIWIGTTAVRCVSLQLLSTTL
jgi:hypothetical protein